MEKENREYAAALYCRLSSEDGGQGDSTSIETQKMQLGNYCREHGIPIFGFYIDDGYSGLNFDRPGFLRMIGDIEKKNVNLVISKDLSRLGRDYIQTGYYTEVFFRSRDVRYIAVNDDVDTLRGDNDIAPFKNILNDMYARDLSRKIKSAKRERAHQGLFISSQAPYGYRQDKDDGNRLVVDKVAAKTVKLIFKLALEGKGGLKIMQELRSRKIPTPSELRRSRGDLLFERYHKEGDEEAKSRWTYATGRSILCNRMYAGDMVNGRYETVNYKTKERVRNPEEKQIIVENTHEAIVPREDFDLVQKYMKARHTQRRYDHENLFSGLLICSQCGRRLAFAQKPAANESIKAFYKCMNHYDNPRACPMPNQINYAFLKNRVRDYVNLLFLQVDAEGDFIRFCLSRMGTESRVEEYRLRKANLEKRRTFLIEVTKRMYEDSANGTLDEATYHKMIGQYREEQKNIQEELKDYSEDKTGEQILSQIKALFRILRKYKDAGATELSKELVNALFDRIVVSPVKQIEGRWFNETQLFLTGLKQEI
jgi:DNA invertase Pin-like site-specific DNA recombinase